MYYCKCCGYRSEGDFCSNRKCAEFCMPYRVNQRSKPDNLTKTLNAVTNDTVWQPEFDRQNDFGHFSKNNRPMEMPVKNSHNCHMPLPPCNDELQIAFATTPFQRFINVYPPEKALMAGTVFAQIDMPYAQKKVFGGYNG